MAVVGVLSAGGSTALGQGDQPAPACDPAVPAALQFAGLPSRIPFGRTEEYGFIRNPASDRQVPEPVTITVFEAGRSFYQDTTRARGDDLYLLTLVVGGPQPVVVRLTFIEVAADGTSCERQLNRGVRGFRDGKRFEAWVERAGTPRPSHAFRPGAGLSFVFMDRFAFDTPYRLCWHRPSGSSRQCRRHRTRAPRRPDSLFAPAPRKLGAWVATWRVGGRIVATWSFRISR